MKWFSYVNGTDVPEGYALVFLIRHVGEGSALCNSEKNYGHVSLFIELNPSQNSEPLQQLVEELSRPNVNVQIFQDKDAELSELERAFKKNHCLLNLDFIPAASVASVSRIDSLKQWFVGEVSKGQVSLRVFSDNELRWIRGLFSGHYFKAVFRTTKTDKVNGFKVGHDTLRETLLTINREEVSAFHRKADKYYAKHNNCYTRAKEYLEIHFGAKDTPIVAPFDFFKIRSPKHYVHTPMLTFSEDKNYFSNLVKLISVDLVGQFSIGSLENQQLFCCLLFFSILKGDHWELFNDLQKIKEDTRNDSLGPLFDPCQLHVANPVNMDASPIRCMDLPAFRFLRQQIPYFTEAPHLWGASWTWLTLAAFLGREQQFCDLLEWIRPDQQSTLLSLKVPSPSLLAPTKPLLCFLAEKPKSAPVYIGYFFKKKDGQLRFPEEKLKDLFTSPAYRSYLDKFCAPPFESSLPMEVKDQLTDVQSKLPSI